MYANKIKLLKTLLAIPRKRLPEPRIFLTSDLGYPSFEDHTRSFIEALSRFEVPFTLFTPNESPNGERGYGALKELMAYADKKGVAVELGSHGVRHELLSGMNPSQAAAFIEESLLAFREEGFDARGFRAPYLSIESFYRNVLKEAGRSGGGGMNVLAYDSSLSFEGTWRASKVHDRLKRKCPHRIDGIWEFPLSCMSDYVLFEKLKQTDEFAEAFWKRKLDLNIEHLNYFLMLLHPDIMAGHLHVLESFLEYAVQKYSLSAFTTCIECGRTG